MNTDITTADALADARLIALATVAGTGRLVEGGQFATPLATLALEGAVALFCLGGHDHPAIAGTGLETLAQLDRASGVPALRACAEHHLLENQAYLEFLLENPEEAEGDDLEGFMTEVARAERVLAALEGGIA